MKSLNELIVDINGVWVGVEGHEPFEVQLSHIPRTEMSKLVESCETSKLTRRGQVEKSLDTEKFLSKFVERAVLDWRGLTLEVLENFLPIRYEKEKAKEELEYSKENAIKLIKESQMFDDWVNEKITNIDTFRQ